MYHVPVLALGRFVMGGVFTYFFFFWGGGGWRILDNTDLCKGLVYDIASRMAASCIASYIYFTST